MSLPLTFFDILWLLQPPLNYLFFYELSITKTHFIETIVPNLKHSLSITLQHFFPYAGHLIVFPTRTKIPEIRYVQGDSVEVTFAECNIDFDDLTGNHPRNCDKFYQLIPRLGECVKLPEYVKIPVFSLQVTFLSNRGISIGLTIHHSLGDVITHYSFLKAWTSVARCGTDESFLANGILPVYERVVKYPEVDEIYLKHAKIETLFNHDYQPPHLSGPTDKVRAKFVLTRTIIDQLKKHVLTHLPTLPYVSSFTVACAYIWFCIAKACNDDEVHLFGIPVDCRARIDPPIPEAYFGNCVLGCKLITKTTLLRGNEGLLTTATLLGENLHKMLTNKDGILKYSIKMLELLSDIMPTSIIAVAGTPKLKFYDLDFGLGKSKKVETISIEYRKSISIDACKESPQDLEIGVSLTATQMQAFIRFFDEGIESSV